MLELYHRVLPQVQTIPNEVDPFPVETYFPDGDEFAEDVIKIRLNCSGGPSDTWAEHLCKGLGEATCEVELDATHCRKVVVQVQAVFCHGIISE